MDLDPAGAALDFDTRLLLAVHFCWNQNSGAVCV
jgi:hypothetical protein